jgi:hypothetical protein
MSDRSGPRLSRLFRALPRLALVLAIAAPAAAAQGTEDPAARRLFQEAQRRLQSDDLAGAENELSLLVQQFPGDVLAPRALLDLIALRRSGGDEAGTEAALRKMLNDYPRAPETAGAFLVQGEREVEKARSQAELENARSTFKRVALLFGADAYPRLDARVQSRLRSAELELQLGNDGAALAALLAALEDEPAGPYRGRVKLLYGQTLLRTADWTAGVQTLQELVDEGRTPGDATSSAAERDRARRLIALAHRQVVRPAAGQARWNRSSRFPLAGVALREPDGVAADIDGRALVVDRRAELVLLIGENGEVAGSKPLADADRPAFAAGGVPLVVVDDAVVLPFDGQRSTFLQPRTGKEAPLKGLRGAARSAFGDWFLLAKSYDGLLNYQTARLGQELLTAQRYELADIDRDLFGRIYLLDAQSNKVLRLTVDRRTVEVLATGTWKKPAAFSLDVLGNVYVLDRGTRKVEIYDARGKLVGSVGPDLGGGLELKDPQDVAVDGNGRLFIADRKLPFVVVLE